jgi:hypothetical protein
LVRGAVIEKTISIVPLSTFLYICSESLSIPDGKFRERLRHVSGYCKLTRVSKTRICLRHDRYPVSNSFLVIASRGFVCVWPCCDRRDQFLTHQNVNKRAASVTRSPELVVDHHETFRSPCSAIRVTTGCSPPKMSTPPAPRKDTYNHGTQQHPSYQFYCPELSRVVLTCEPLHCLSHDWQ